MYRSLFVLFVLFSTTTTFVSTASARKRIRFIRGAEPNKPIRAKELAVQFSPSFKPYIENWSMWAWNKKGWTVYAVAFVGKMHLMMSTRLGVQLTLRSPSGQLYHKLVEYKAKRMRSSKQRFDVSVKGTRLQGTPQRGRWRIKLPGVGCDLTYERQLSGFRQYGGTLRFGKRRYTGMPFAPRIRVKGTLSFGGRTVKFDGMGYADRSWQNSPDRIARQWYILRAMDKDYTLIASNLRPHKRWRPRSLPTIALAKGSKWLFRGKLKKLRFRVRKRKRDRLSGYSVPQDLRYTGQTTDGRRFRVDIKHQRLYHHLDVLAHIPSVLRIMVQKLFTKPYVFRYRVKTKITLSGLNGKAPQVITLPGYSESVFFSK